MRKGIFVLLLAFASQLHGAQSTNESSFFFADLLTWKLSEGCADNWAKQITPAGATRSINVFAVPFEWDPGVRLGVGRNSNYDNWDTVLYYTWFQTKGITQESVTSGGIYSPYLGNFFVNNTNGANFGPNYLNASINWKLFYNTVDFELGRKFHINSSLNLRPYLGLKLAIINQRINTNWRNPTVATTFTSAVENFKNDFYGLGPVLGLASSWKLYNTQQSSFKIIGNIAGALLAGHWTLTDQYENSTPTSVTVQNDTVKSAATMARALIGLEWNSKLSRSDLSLRLGYEAQVWFDQLKFYTLDMGRLDDLMSLQGAVLELSINF